MLGARLREIAHVFFKLGLTSFGGPAAHIAMMDDEIVRRRAWMSREEFLDLISASNLIPGPNSTELAIHIGHRRAGWRGLMVAGMCFIAPAVVIVMVMAWAYVEYGTLPQIERMLYGVKPVVMAIVIQALCFLGKSALKNAPLTFVGLLSLGLTIAGVNEIAVLLLAGAFGVVVSRSRDKSSLVMLGGLGVFGHAKLGAAAALMSVQASFSMAGIFWYFAKVGSVLYGSGYVLLAFLRSDLVESRGWMTEAQLLDAVTVGQLTPGPVFTTATFVGYIIHGPWAALAATLGIFLPAFVFVALSIPFVSRLRDSKRASAFLSGVNVASLALMAFVSFFLARAAVVDLLTLGLAALSLFLLIRMKVASTWLIVAGGLVGLVTSF